jgi:hypothetical protein
MPLLSNIPTDLPTYRYCHMSIFNREGKGGRRGGAEQTKGREEGGEETEQTHNTGHDVKYEHINVQNYHVNDDDC